MEKTRYSDYYLEVKDSSGNVRGALTVSTCWELAHKTSGRKVYSWNQVEDLNTAAPMQPVSTSSNEVPR